MEHFANCGQVSKDVEKDPKSEHLLTNLRNSTVGDDYMQKKRYFIVNLLFSEFRVEDYDELCEDFSKIDKVVCLKYSYFKIFCFCLLNLLTAFIINLFIVWYPFLKLNFVYSSCSLKDAKFVGVYGRGNI